MNYRNILVILLLILIPLGQGEPLATSYWGYVTVDGITKPNAIVTVYDSSGKEVARATSLQDATFQVTVPRDDPSTQAIEGVVDGETITFKVGSNTATSRIIDAKGSNNRLDLAVSSGGVTPGTSPSGGGSSGSGGGGVSAEPYENIVKKETTKEETLAKDISKNFSFTATELPVSEISITSNINTELMNVQVELLKNRSTFAKEDAPGNIYKYVNIWVGTSGFAVPKNIKEGIIRFKIENSWMTSNGFTDADIVMLRWDGTQWVKLVTKKTNSDGEYMHFEAKTNSFSPFAISGAKAAQIPATTNVSPSPTEQQGSPAPSPVKQSSGFGLVLAIVGLMLVVLKKRGH